MRTLQNSSDVTLHQLKYGGSTVFAIIIKRNLRTHIYNFPDLSLSALPLPMSELPESNINASHSGQRGYKTSFSCIPSRFTRLHGYRNRFGKFLRPCASLRIPIQHMCTIRSILRPRVNYAVDIGHGSLATAKNAELRFVEGTIHAYTCTAHVITINL